MDNNLYPNDGQVYAEPKDQIDEKNQEANEVLSALPLINEMLERFNQRIAFYSSVDSIPEEVQTKPDEFMHVATANKLVKDNLEQEKNYLEGLINEYVKKL